MKRYLLITACIIIGINSAFAQNFISITPNNAAVNTTLNTTVTASGFFFTQTSAPSTWGDFYMQLGATTILPNSVNILNNDLLDVNWTIPANATIGNYDVIWYAWDPWIGGMVYHDIPGGFNVGDVFISGTVFYDEDSSGTMNGNDNPMYNQKVLLLPDSLYSFSDQNGSYTIATTSGNKDVKIEPSPLWSTSTPNPVSIVLGSTNVTGIDFGLNGLLDIIDINSSMTYGAFPRCLTNVPFWITYTNEGTLPTHGEVIFTKASNCTYVSSSIPPDNINGNTYTWNYINLMPGETRSLIVTLTLPVAGSTINNNVQITARDAFNTIVDADESNLTGMVLCSYDPNDKSVIPEGVYAQHYTLMTDTLDFTIRFQNTGNDTAFKVMILDTLNKNILDINSFQMIVASHPVVTELRTNGRVTFTFDNILLPDSNTNEPGSHGFVRYRCRIKTGLTNNTILNNRGHIYFDLNSAIITNTTLNTLVYQIPVGINEPDASGTVTVIPNPVIDNAIISFSNPLYEKYTIKIYTVEGKLVYTESTHDNIIVVDRDLLSKGLYIFELNSENLNSNFKGKFVKQ